MLERLNVQHNCLLYNLKSTCSVIQYNSLLSSAVSTINKFLLRLVRRFLVFVLVWSLACLDTSPTPDGLRGHAGVVAGSDGLGNLGCVASPL